MDVRLSFALPAQEPPSGFLPLCQRLAVEAVVDVVTALFGSDKIGIAKDAKMLRDCPLSHAQPRRKGAHAEVPTPEKLDDAESGLHGQYLEESG